MSSDPESKDGRDPERGTETNVDLGDDLLEKTAGQTRNSFHIPAPVDDVQSVVGESAPPLPSSRDEIEDQLQSARILVNEGLIEEGKKLLRRILIADSRNLTARRKLDEIHEIELQQIFEGRERRRGPQHGRRRDDAPEEEVDSEKVLRELDADLGLGLITDGDPDTVRELEMSLFQEREEMARFADRVDAEYSKCRPRDRLDIGIAFFEMGLLDLAIRQFTAAARDAETRIPATALLASALMRSGHPFDAVLALEPLISDSELDGADKLELLYLMGRANEQLGKHDAATRYYAQAVEVDPTYRDAEERMKRCAGIRS
jgi:tetratricopeptide (TPR) repeat protein